MEEKKKADNRSALEMMCDEHRDTLKQLGAMVLELKNLHNKNLEGSTKESSAEVFANIMLCYRHIEDASMRLGKVKQHLNDGISIYDKNVVGSPEK